MLNLQEKKYKDAEEIFGRLRESAPLDPRGSLLLAETYLAQGRTANAIGLLQTEISKNPQRDDLRMQLASMAVRSADYDLAIKELTLLANKNPKRADLQWSLGEVYRSSGNFKAALESFKKTRELAPNNGDAHLAFALMLEATGQSAQAKPIYEQILKLQPDNAVALNNLAFMMAQSGTDLDQALTMVQRAKQKFPNDANIADTMGLIYIKKGLSDDAIRIYRELVQKNPTHVTWRLHLARALYQKGDKLQARKELEACAKNRPNRSEAAEIKDLMGKVG
jgi:tetratricopeptide (TPR) repeat protein